MTNQWIEHCKTYAKENNMKYSHALKDENCKRNYRQMKGGDLSNFISNKLKANIPNPIQKPLLNSLTSNLQLGVPPNVKNLLSKYGNARILYIKVNRQPVQQAMTQLLNLFSKNQSNFNNELKKLGYDRLYHLMMIIKTDIGRVSIEKNERINMSERPIEVETMNVNFPADLTLNKLFENTKRFMGNNFLPYDPYKNNCQNFVLSVLQANNLNTPELQNFVKQNTDTLFYKDKNLQNISKITTNIGAIANVVRQGGSIYYEKPSAQLKNIK